MTNFVITLKWVLLVITLTRVSADDTHGIEKRGTNADSKKIVCYYTNWSVYRPGTAKFTPQNINPYLCTHLIYAFGGLDKENGLRPYDKYQDIEQGGYAKFTGLKTYNKNLKTMLAIGGWNEGSSRFSNLVADEDRRATFVKNVVKFLRQNNFDGLDLDWEYPAFRDGSKSADKENYAALVKELREEFEKESSKTGRQRLLLTMAVPAGIEYIDKGYDIPKLNKYLDFMNILSYDYHSAYEPNVNHHSPLYSLQEESEYNFDAQLTIDYTIQHYLKKGADPEKLVLGIPTYGRSYTLFNADSTDLGSPADGPGEQGEATREKGYLAYYEICSNVEKDEWTIMQPKKSAMGPYAYRGNQWVGYDDADIIKLKAKYVNEKGLGGIMYWSIDNDDFRGKCHGKQYPLIEAGKEALLATSGSSSPNAIAASTEEKRTKLGTRKHRPKQHSTTAKPQTTTAKITTTTTTSNPLSTPEPPTTPDPGTDFVCKEEGFFAHPRDCKKYFWCLDSGPSNLGIVAHQFTCPSGLMFNKAADSCDYARNVICNKKEKSTTTTTTAKTTTTGSPSVKQSTTTTSTTTTTEQPPLEEDYEEEDVESEEDPKAIKQLITLIKKLGGITELEKQLKLDDSSKEVTTPAISKNLYNKVFSGPTTSRFRNQHRNGPSGPQNEGLTSNDEVPYRKDKPQYVTIQRSRPLKNVAQDTEDSGTTNNKAIQPNRNADTDYADAAEDEEITTVKYSTPSRSRTTTDGRTSSLKYVVLERNRPDRTTTVGDELASESPSHSTQRYITLVRNRPSTSSTPSNDVDESSTEASSPQRATRPSTRAFEPATERSREKVSEIETTTAPITTLPVTSAQYVTTNKVSSPNTTDYLYADSTTTNSPNTYLVFAQKVTDDDQFRKPDDRVDSTPELHELETSTELVTTSIATTIITTIRESATEKTRIPLRMYREFLKRNRNETRHDLTTNLVSWVGGKRLKENRTTAKPKSRSTTEATTRRNPFNRRRSSLSAYTEVTKSLNQTTEHTTHSRFFGRRNKSNYSTIEPSSELSTRSPDATEGDTRPSTHRYNQLRTTSTESNAEIDNFFKRRRSSTTTEKHGDSSSTINPFSRTASRYFSRNRKTDNVTTESPSKGRFTQDKSYRKTTKSEILDSDENNRYGRVQETLTPTVSDQLSQSDSNKQTEINLKKQEFENQTEETPVITTLTSVTEEHPRYRTSSTTHSSLADHFRHRTHPSTRNSSTDEENSPLISSTTPHTSQADHFRHRTHQSANSSADEDHRTATTPHSSFADHFRHRTHQTSTNSSVDEDVSLKTPTTHSSLVDHYRHRTHQTSTNSLVDEDGSPKTPTTHSSSIDHFRRTHQTSTNSSVDEDGSLKTSTTHNVFANHFRHRAPLTSTISSVDEDASLKTPTTHSSFADQFRRIQEKVHNSVEGKSGHHKAQTHGPTEKHHRLSPTTHSSFAEHFRHTIQSKNSSADEEPVTRSSFVDHAYHKTTSPNIYNSITTNHNRHTSTSSPADEIDYRIETTYSPVTEESRFKTHAGHFASTYRPENVESSSGTVYSRINPRNNSRFLKNPEPEYKLQLQDKKQDDVVRGYSKYTPEKPKKDSPIYVVQRANESQIEFEVRIRHENDIRPRDKSNPKESASAKGRSLRPEEHPNRGKKKFSDSLDDSEVSNTAYVIENERNQADKTYLEGRRARVHYSSPATTTVGSRDTTPNARIRNRGSIKAQNSLSKAEIKELAQLVEATPKKHSLKHRPINRIEETYYESAPVAESQFTPRGKIEEMYLTNTDNFGFSKIYTIPNDLGDRFYDDATDEFYRAGEVFTTQSSDGEVAVNDVLRVSETKYSNEGTRHAYTAGDKSTPDKSQHKASENVTNTELSSRLRGNFRRNNPTQRTRSSTSTTTTTTTAEYMPSDTNKLSSRFRRRKGRPENRSINTARSENFIPLAEIESSTVTRHKNYDISHRGTSLVSDYLPVPAPLYRGNQTQDDQLNVNNLNLEDLEAQTINPANSNYNTDDVSDLADPAVAAIAHLKTLPPASPQITFPRIVSTAPPLITYTSEPPEQYHRIKSTFKTTASVPIYQHRVSNRRGTARPSAKTSTTQLPSLQDIYSDYHDTDVEYHADPVDIPISGKVRIHSDGYIECLDMGNFPHPFSCRKFISCAKMEYDNLLGWEYTCPKGLSFDPIGGICNWAAGLGCKD